MLVHSLIDLDASPVTDLLAPVNSGAALLSLVLLSIRVMYRRLFT
jgi:hypothetical protein